MTLLAVSAVGADRPGIVAAIAGVLHEYGGNIEDSSMTILRGHFAMTLIVAADHPAATLEAALTAAASDLLLTVREVAPEAEHRRGRPYVVSVYGADHPGIVARVAGLLAERSVNITDLTTRLVGDAVSPLYAMVLDVDLPPGANPAEVEGARRGLAAELDVEATMHAAEPVIL